MLRTALRFLATGFVLLLVAVPFSVADGQSGNPGLSSSRRMASRAELETASEEFDRLAASTAYSEAVRARARTEAAAIRRRLTEGDFQAGDRLLLRVEGQVMLDDTVTVLDGQRITVRGIRQVSLAGTLRSELETFLRAELNEIVRNTTVSATPLMRMSVLGSVTRPGFLSVPQSTTLDRLITLAGGPVANAGIARMTLTRADTLIATAQTVQRAMANGTTLEALGVIDGDALVVPPQNPPWDRTQALQLVTAIVFPLLTLFLVRR